jgi:hypothetical protein
VPEWLDLPLRIGGAILLIGGIMWFAFRRAPQRDPNKDHSSGRDFGDGGPSHDAGGGHGHAG